MKRFVVVAGVLALLLGVACGGDDPTVDGPAATGGTTQPTEPTEEPTEPADGGGTEVVLVDFAFQPSDVEVAAGSTLQLRNGSAQTPHTYTVRDQDVDVTLEALQSEEVTVDLDPGTYDVVCTFHEAQGMVGTLTVT